MDRRAFLRRTVGGTAVVAASVQSGWGLKTLRRLLTGVFREPISDGLVDLVTATSLHGLSTSTYPTWAAGFA